MRTNQSKGSRLATAPESQPKPLARPMLTYGFGAQLKEDECRKAFRRMAAYVQRAPDVFYEVGREDGRRPDPAVKAREHARTCIRLAKAQGCGVEETAQAVADYFAACTAAALVDLMPPGERTERAVALELHREIAEASDAVFVAAVTPDCPSYRDRAVREVREAVDAGVRYLKTLTHHTPTDVRAAR